jgi:threonine dehydrogenase-like Zn-dependent dehydrogenase
MRRQDAGRYGGFGNICRRSVFVAAGAQMRAITIRPGVADSARLEDVPDPSPAEGSILARTMALGVCATDNDAVFGSVNANRGHYEAAAQALAQADHDWLDRLITRRVPLARWREALEHRSGDIKVVIEFAG